MCAIDGRAPRDGKVIEELGNYDPMVKDTDARAILKGERIAYWLSVGTSAVGKVRRADQEVRQERTRTGRSSKRRWRRSRPRRPQAPGALYSATEAAGTGTG